MTVRCTAFCGQHWRVSSDANLDKYVCPECEAILREMSKHNGLKLPPAPVWQTTKYGRAVCIAG